MRGVNHMRVVLQVSGNNVNILNTGYPQVMILMIKLEVYLIYLIILIWKILNIIRSNKHYGGINLEEH